MESLGEFFADKLMDLANLAAAALVFGQAVEGKGFQWTPFLIGLAFFLICVVVSSYLRRKRR